LGLAPLKAQAVLDARAVYLDGGAHASRVPVSASHRNPSSATIPSGATPDGATGTVALPKLCTLADLYDPLSMPPELVQAHAEPDHAMEKCYRPEPFHSDRERVEYLFSLYEKLTAPLLPVTPKTRGRRSQTAATTTKQRKGRTPGLPGQAAQKELT
jgi:hypothetical protein